MSRVVLLPLLLLPLLACGDKASNEALLFLDRYEALEHPDPRVGRARLDTFRHMVFQSERVQAAQTICSDVHAAVFEAEEQSAQARHLVERLEATAPADRDADQRQAIEDALSASQDAVDRAAEGRGRCEEAIADLRTRYAPGRE